MLTDFPNTIGLNKGGERFMSLSDYDVIIAFDPDWTRLAPSQRKLLQKWVEENSGGIIFVAGPVYSFQLARPGGQDFKTRLQELAARRFDELPRYHVADDGPDHAKRFFATVYVAGEPHGAGEGRSKKQAEQAAAREAWQTLQTVLVPDAAAAVSGADGEEDT